MSTQTEYYRSHWVTIEDERLARYDLMFRWGPHLDPLFDGFDVGEGMSVADYGCGPGWVAIEMARRVGPSGRVYGCDLNQTFLSVAAQHGEEAGVADVVEWRHVADDRVPLPDRSVDRVFCKNVLEYVPSIDSTLAEFRRVLKPGGLMRLVDSDWDMIVIEPLGAQRTDELMRYARHAYNDAQAGRHLYGAARRVGFDEVQVRVTVNADTQGNIRVVLSNILGYAVAGGLAEAEAQRMAAEIDAAIERREFMALLPQFIVTAVAP
ncbi:MAG TPA: methyltransferase domain-containing protein [Dehalococcoidia bacterium]|nr:methyltransferase domain-containing protein [Dehalococcoidia bacterium]